MIDQQLCGCGNPLDAPGRDICFDCYVCQQSGKTERRIENFTNETTRCMGAPPASITVRHAKKETDMAYDNRNRGSLFKNDEKKGDTSHDYSGTIDIDGSAYWLNGWINTAKKTGKKFLSLSIKPKTEKQP